MSPNSTRRATEDVLAELRRHGHRVTPQRRVIVGEILRTSGHISPQKVVERVRLRDPAVNASTIYRTLGLLEKHGLLSHSHAESGHEYHLTSAHDHVHLVCASCGSDEALSIAEVEPLRDQIARHNGFWPDFTHFAISGLCSSCRGDGEAT
jgi:Fur family ferric uptake transcriptional regulator